LQRDRDSGRDELQDCAQQRLLARQFRKAAVERRQLATVRIADTMIRLG
jgi:hypothetical protein